MFVAIVIATAIGVSGGLAIEDKYDVFDKANHSQKAPVGQTAQYPTSRK